MGFWFRRILKIIHSLIMWLNLYNNCIAVCFMMQLRMLYGFPMYLCISCSCIFLWNYFTEWLSPLTKSEGDIVMMCIHASIRPVFATIIWKANDSINFKFYVCVCWVSFQVWFAFGWHWSNFGPLVAKKLFKVGQNGVFWPLSEKIFAQSNSNLVCTLIGWMFRIGLLLHQILALL